MELHIVTDDDFTHTPDTTMFPVFSNSCSRVAN